MASNLSIQISDDFQKEFEAMIQEVARKVIYDVANNPLERKSFYNKREAALYLGVSYQTLQKLIIMGMPTIRLESKVLLSRKSIDEFMQTLEDK